MHRLSLHNHRADKDKIRPEDVFFFEGLDAHIDKFLFPAGGKHSSDSGQTQRRQRGAFLNHLKSVFKAPEGIGVIRVYK